MAMSNRAARLQTSTELVEAFLRQDFREVESLTILSRQKEKLPGSLTSALFKLQGKVHEFGVVLNYGKMKGYDEKDMIATLYDEDVRAGGRFALTWIMWFANVRRIDVAFDVIDARLLDIALSKTELNTSYARAECNIISWVSQRPIASNPYTKEKVVNKFVFYLYNHPSSAGVLKDAFLAYRPEFNVHAGEVYLKLSREGRFGHASTVANIGEVNTHEVHAPQNNKERGNIF